MSGKKFTHIEKLDEAGYRSFGITFACILLILFGGLLPWLFSHQWPLWPWILALILVATALLKPNALWWIYKPWMIFGQVMGKINTQIILSLAFFAMITPIAIVFKIGRKDPMNRKFSPDAMSYWKKSQQTQSDHMRNIY